MYTKERGQALTKRKEQPTAQEIIPARTKEKERRTQIPVRSLARLAVDAALSKKGRDVLVLDVHDVSGIADIFILVTGDSDLQIRAIHDAVRKDLREQTGERPWHVEGADHAQWVLLDYVDLVVHIFTEEKRTFYSLERLWGDAPHESVPETGSGDNVDLLAE